MRHETTSRTQNTAESRILHAANKLSTPAFIYDEEALRVTVKFLKSIANEAKAQILFSVKALILRDVLATAEPHLDGFSVSSLFEARLASTVLNGSGALHFTSPCIRTEDVAQLNVLCDTISFNSLTQLSQFQSQVSQATSLGVRVNTNISSVTDARYDPCRPHSKLGIPLGELDNAFRSEPGLFNRIDGIHFHTNCESESLEPLMDNVDVLVSKLNHLLDRCRWINLGGGYLFETGPYEPLFEVSELLRSRHGVSVLLEPGEAVVGTVGFLLSSVVDMLERDGKRVAVIDTSVNHLPQVFEYQYRPDVHDAADAKAHAHILAGCSCLAGDLFGEYRFDEPLKIGSKILFRNVGAYSFVKANRFNGINLPTIYSLTDVGQLHEKRRYTYEDFEEYWS